MAKKLLMVLVALALAVGVAACGGGSKDDDAGSGGGTTTTAKDTSPIVIGAAIGKTGLLQPYDVPTFEAAKMKAEEINAAGGIDGRKIEFVEADMQSDPAQGKRAAEKVLSEGADILLVACDFDFGSPSALVAQQKGKVVFSLCAHSAKFGVQGIGPLAYTLSIATFSMGDALAQFAKEQGYKKTFLLLDDTIAYDPELCSGFQQVTPADAIAGTATFKNSDSSIASQITKIKASGADSVLLCSYPPGGASALRQLRAAGVDVPILSGDGMDGTFWTKAVPQLSDFYVSTAISVFGDSDDDAVNQFVKDFTETTGAAPAAGFVVTGASIIEALKIAIEKAGTTDGPELAKALDSFSDEPLTIGPSTFTPELHIDTKRPQAIIKYTDGKPAFFGTAAPSGEAKLSLK